MMKILIMLVTICGLVACTSKKPTIDTNAIKDEIIEADRAFSKLSEQKGLKKAYMEYIDSNGVLLRPNNVPIAGANAVDFIIQSNDSAFIMTWEPKSTTIAASGELGYTYGIYSFKQKKVDTVFFGTYVTIWRKQLNGKWKFLLQTGNDGLE